MTETPSFQLLVGFVADLLFASKIESAAAGLNYEVRWIERLSQLPPMNVGLLEAQAPSPAEQLSGPKGQLLEQLTRWQPALLIFDLGNAEIPWREWIPLLKSAPSTRRIPLICYGSHVQGDVLRAARSAGADAVLARSAFSADLPGLIQKYAHTPDLAAILDSCQQALSPKALEGLALFNHGEYFEAHEVMEAAWNDDATPGRELYRAVLQVAVAYLQIERRNYKGALKMFLRLRQWLAPLPDECRGIDVARLRQDADAAHQRLLDLGEAGIDHFDPGLFKPVIYKLPEDPGQSEAGSR